MGGVYRIQTFLDFDIFYLTIIELTGWPCVRVATDS